MRVSSRKIISWLIPAVLPVALAAQQPPPPGVEVGAAQLALVNVPARPNSKLVVTSPAFIDGGDIPFENTQYRGNMFPGLAWSAAPAGTRSYVIIMQDGDALRNGAPILHWTMANIPAATRKLDPKMTTVPSGSIYGPNVRGPNQPYTGPRTPAGPKHRYHLQVFALDTTIPVDSTTTYVTLTDAMKTHVLASGELIGLGQAPPQPL